MKKLLTILILFIAVRGYSQTANAGSNVTIYISQGTTTATLNGSASSATSYLWSEVSSDYSSGGTITSATSKTAGVTGLTNQGVFYFRIGATTGGTTHYDTMAVIVDYSPLPANATFWAGAFYDSLHQFINTYADTTSNSGGGQFHYWPDQTIYFDRGRSLDMNIDNENGKFKATVEDGYPWSGNPYGRTELSYGFGNGRGAPIDTSHTYMFEWKGYFTQNETQAAFTSGGNIFGVTVFWQMHGKDGNSPPFQFIIGENVANNPSAGHNISFMEVKPVGCCSGSVIALKTFAQYGDFYNKAHTIRIYLREGNPGGPGFVKITVNDSTVYYRTATALGIPVGRSMEPGGGDYPKFATIYDYDNRVADNTFADTTSARLRGKKFSLITESYNEYTIDTTYSGIAAPTVTTSGNQSISISTATISATATHATGQTITGYLWTKVSGTGTITSSTSASTGLTGLSGVSVYNCKVTQSDGQTATSSNLTITVTGAAAPTIYAGNNQTISTSSTTLTATYTLASGHTGTFNWVLVSGHGGGSITSHTSSSTGVTGLSVGTYRFGCTLTQDDSQTAYDYVDITVTANPQQIWIHHIPRKFINL